MSRRLIYQKFLSPQSLESPYKKRFDIEEMFRYFKSGGYKLEYTNVSGNRLTSRKDSGQGFDKERFSSSLTT